MWNTRTVGVELEIDMPWGRDQWQNFINNDLKKIHKCEAYTDYSYQHGVVEGFDFHLTYDASVHGRGEYGYELITRPFTFEDTGFLGKLRGVLLSLYKNGGDVNQSCGLHIHIGCGDFPTKSFINLITFYITFQDAIFALVPAERRVSVYTSGFSDTTKDFLLRKMKKIRSKDKLLYGVWRAPTARIQTHYQMLNLFHAGMSGHYEVRAGHGSINPQRIMNWCELHLKIADFCNKHKRVDSPFEIQGEPVKSMLGMINARNLQPYFESEQRRFGQ